jgi:hypothetical protein
VWELLLEARKKKGKLFAGVSKQRGIIKFLAGGGNGAAGGANRADEIDFFLKAPSAAAASPEVPLPQNETRATPESIRRREEAVVSAANQLLARHATWKLGAPPSTAVHVSDPRFLKAGKMRRQMEATYNGKRDAVRWLLAEAVGLLVKSLSVEKAERFLDFCSKNTDEEGGARFSSCPVRAYRSAAVTGDNGSVLEELLEGEVELSGDEAGKRFVGTCGFVPPGEQGGDGFWELRITFPVFDVDYGDLLL